MNIASKIQHYMPYDGGFRLRAERWRRAAKRMGRYDSLRRAWYPWNAATHYLRWKLASREHLAAWLKNRLQVDLHFWLFIAGCNNSGTTLLREILRSHPGIRALPREGQILTGALPSPSALGLPRLFTKRMDVFRWTEKDDPTPAFRCKYDWERFVDRRPGIVLEKSPENTIRTRWLQENFAPARFITLVRSPYAVCEGTRRRSGHSIEETAHHWAEANRCLLEDIPCLERQLFLRYEHFCASPAKSLVRIQEFLDLEEPFQANVIETSEVHNIASRASAVRDFNTESLRRLSQEDIAIINRIAGPVMEGMGYKQMTGAGDPAAESKNALAQPMTAE